MHHLLSEVKAAVFRRNKDGAGILLSVYDARQKCDQRSSDYARKSEQRNYPPLFDSADRSYGSNDESKVSTWHDGVVGVPLGTADDLMR